jgi:hypothetical protein
VAQWCIATSISSSSLSSPTRLERVVGRVDNLFVDASKAGDLLENVVLETRDARGEEDDADEGARAEATEPEAEFDELLGREAGDVGLVVDPGPELGRRAKRVAGRGAAEGSREVHGAGCGGCVSVIAGGLAL